MAVERQSSASDFESISRLKGALFEYLTLGASVIGLFALAILLIYVFVDAFALSTAGPEWLLTYFLTLVVPFIGFCLYSIDSRRVTRQAIIALGGGLVGIAVPFVIIETYIASIPRLTWQITYLFVIVAPTTGTLATMASREPAGKAGFGLVGRIVGGAALGAAVATIFLVFDDLSWFLAYTTGIVPAVGTYIYVRSTGVSVIIAIVGIVLSGVLRNIISVYPSSAIIFVWTVGIPLAVVAAGLVHIRGRSQQAVVGVGIATVIAAGSGVLFQPSVLPTGSGVAITAMMTAPVAVYLTDAFDNEGGRLGLTLPVLIVGGAVLGALIVQSFGIQSPEMWLTLEYITEAPSRNAREAGLYPAIVGSVIIIILVAIISFILGVGAAVFLEEYTSSSGLTGSIARILQINIANLAAVPSVVYGLLGLGLFANGLGLGLGTAVTAALTLALLILPITVISSQEAVRSVPDELRQGSYAMGATRWQTTKNVVLPEAMPGILTGTILALGRAIGETAPLIMIGAATTVFNAPNSVWSAFSAMPMQIYAWAGFPQSEFRYGVVAAGVVTLLIVLISMNGAAIIIRNRLERST
jgi:phosphate transport system permease protein